jgi:ribosomal protein L34E
MHPEIEKLIKLAIADGEITEKERAVILRKATTLGEDIDEVEMVLDGELALLKKEQQIEQGNKSTSNKYGDLRKCPSCGAPVQSFTTKCAECGHEFQGIKATSSINELFQLLMKAENEERAKPEPKGLFAYDKKNQHESSIQRKLANIIASYPVPTSKEDIIEFLAQAVSKAEIKSALQIFNGWERQFHNITATAWNNKCKEIIMKARFSMKDDKNLLNEIEVYAKQLKIK